MNFFRKNNGNQQNPNNNNNNNNNNLALPKSPNIPTSHPSPPISPLHSLAGEEKSSFLHQKLEELGLSKRRIKNQLSSLISGYDNIKWNVLEDEYEYRLQHNLMSWEEWWQWQKFRNLQRQLQKEHYKQTLRSFLLFSIGIDRYSPDIVRQAHKQWYVPTEKIDPTHPQTPEERNWAHRIFEDCGGAFIMGYIGGSLWFGFKGFRSSPWGIRLRSAFSASRARALPVGMTFGMWGMCFALGEFFTRTHGPSFLEPFGGLLGGGLAGLVLSLREKGSNLMQGAFHGALFIAVLDFVTWIATSPNISWGPSFHQLVFAYSNSLRSAIPDSNPKPGLINTQFDPYAPKTPFTPEFTPQQLQAVQQLRDQEKSTGESTEELQRLILRQPQAGQEQILEIELMKSDDSSRSDEILLANQNDPLAPIPPDILPQVLAEKEKAIQEIADSLSNFDTEEKLDEFDMWYSGSFEEMMDQNLWKTWLDDVDLFEDPRGDLTHPEFYYSVRKNKEKYREILRSIYAAQTLKGTVDRSVLGPDSLLEPDSSIHILPSDRERVPHGWANSGFIEQPVNPVDRPPSPWAPGLDVVPLPLDPEQRELLQPHARFREDLLEAKRRVFQEQTQKREEYRKKYIDEKIGFVKFYRTPKGLLSDAQIFEYFNGHHWVIAKPPDQLTKDLPGFPIWFTETPSYQHLYPDPDEFLTNLDRSLNKSQGPQKRATYQPATKTTKNPTTVTPIQSQK